MEDIFVRKNQNESEENHLININFFLDKGNDNLKLRTGISENDKPISKKPKSKPKKKDKIKTKKMPDGNDAIVSTDDEVEEIDSRDLTMVETNTPYNTMYNDTNELLKQSIHQIDVLNSDVKNQIDYIKQSKTLKKKYDYLAELSSTAGALISTRIAAIKELNKSITDSNNLDLKRIKELKLNENEADDDKSIMDMYNAFISTPVGTYENAGGGQMPMQSPFGVDTSAITMAGGAPIACGIGNAVKANEMTSVDHMMRLERNPNVQTVVMYDNSTGNRWFDVIDVTTNQSVPNVEKPDSMFLEDLSIDVRNGIARNNNLDLSYKLIVTNNNLSEY